MGGLAAGSVIVALVPIAVAVIRALSQDWVPIGDNALSAIRGADVLGGDLPLLGTWSSASLAAGVNINHPGPLQFDLLALPVAVLGSARGVAVGTALLNGAAVGGTAWFAYRRGGSLTVILAMATTATLGWSMGSELLFEPWNPHAVLLPLLLFLMLVWSLLDGDVLALPPAVAVASLIVQTHLSYVVLVPVLAAAGAAGLAWTNRKAPRRLAVVAAGSVILLGLCWAQPIAEQVSRGDDGNLARLVEHGQGSDVGSIGYHRATQLTATVVALPPWWGRPSFRDAFQSDRDPRVFGPPEPDDIDLPSTGAAGAGLMTVAGLLALAGAVTVRSRDRVAGTALVVAALALAASFFTLGRAPDDVFGLVPHKFRFLWPVAAFTTLTLVVVAGRRLVEARPRVWRPALTGGAAALALVVAVANLPASNQAAGPSFDAWAIPVVRDLGAQLDDLEGDGLLLVDTTEGFADPFGTAIMAELERRGIPFVVTESGWIRQLGDDRGAAGRAPRFRLVRTQGTPARRPPELGSRRVAFHAGLDRGETRELAGLEDRLTPTLVAGELELTELGQEAVDAGAVPRLGEVLAGTGAVRELLGSSDLAIAVNAGLVAPGPAADDLERYAELRRQSERATVALDLRPIDGAP